MAASGLWQFIPGTGSRFGLQRTAYVDERNSFDEATRASARYLKFLYNRYGDWELAIAGYNCGEGNVDRADSRAGVRNFWAAYPYLPQETRNYVPNILATILIANNPNQYGFGHIRPAQPLTYDRIRIPASTNLSLDRTGFGHECSISALSQSAPADQHNAARAVCHQHSGGTVKSGRRAVPPHTGFKINNTNLANSSSGETWQNISNRTGVSVNDLIAANPGMATPQGKVFVPFKGNNVQNIVYSRPTNLPSTAAKIRVVKAKAGETVAKVAQRSGVDATEVAKYNGLLPNTVLTAGREIKIPGK